MDISTDCCTCWAQCIGVCRCLQQWSVEHSHTCRLGSGRPCSTDAHQDRGMVGTWTASRVEIWHMLQLQCHQGPLGTICLYQDSDHVYLRPGYHLHQERVDWRMKWRSVVFSDEIVSVCMRVMDHSGVWRRPGEHLLPEYIHPRYTGPTSAFMVWGVISYNLGYHPSSFWQDCTGIQFIVPDPGKRAPGLSFVPP